MKKLLGFRRGLLIAIGVLLFCVLLFAVSALYLHVAGIEIASGSPGRTADCDELAEAYSRAQYSGYYEQNDDYMNAAFVDKPWFGYAFYDVFTATMTVYLNETTDAHIMEVQDYIETVDQGGCTYVFDTCSVSFGVLKSDLDRINAIRPLLSLLGMTHAVQYRDQLWIKMRPILWQPAAALVYGITAGRESLVFYHDSPNNSPAADG